VEQRKKDTILDCARRCFARFGFKKTSIDEVAQKAGVAKGTVYLACESKEDLFYQVLHREIRAWSAEGARMIDPRVPADEQLVTLARWGLTYLDERPLVRDLLFGVVEEVLPLWKERLAELRDLGIANLVEVLRLGIRQKIFRADLDLEEVAHLLQDMQIATFVYHDRPRPDRLARLERRARAGFDLVLNGLRV
jgi:AcrR family transcriptional regulator